MPGLYRECSSRKWHYSVLLKDMSVVGERKVVDEVECSPDDAALIGSLFGHKHENGGLAGSRKSQDQYGRYR